ncbi:MAG: efflux transporter periplasmic adaptor subunit, partial [Rhodoplanes sp.]
VDQRADVLRVPNQALRYVPSAPESADKALRSHPASSATGGSEAQVWVLRDGRPTAIPVALGLEDDTFTEIVSGDLKPGGEVIAAEQNAAANRPAPPPRLRF